MHEVTGVSNLNNVLSMQARTVGISNFNFLDFIFFIFFYFHITVET